MKKMVKFSTIAAALALPQMASAVPISTSFGPLITFETRPTSPLTATLAVDPNINSNLRFDLSFAGDLDSSIENFRVSLDGLSLGTVCNNLPGDDAFNVTFAGSDACSQADNTLITTSATLTLSTAQSLFSDGFVTIRFDNFTSSVSSSTDFSGPPINATGFTFAAVGSLNYEAAAPEPISAPQSAALFGIGLVGAGFLMSRRGSRREDQSG